MTCWASYDFTCNFPMIRLSALVRSRSTQFIVHASSRLCKRECLYYTIVQTYDTGLQSLTCSIWLHFRFCAHRPSIKGTELLFIVIKAIIIMVKSVESMRQRHYWQLMEKLFKRWIEMTHADIWDIGARETAIWEQPRKWSGKRSLQNVTYQMPSSHTRASNGSVHKKRYGSLPLLIGTH